MTPPPNLPAGGNFFLRYCWEWLKYTPYFFRHAPVRMWWDYFGSCHRISKGLVRAKDYLSKAEDVWDYGARRQRVLNRAKGTLP